MRRVIALAVRKVCESVGRMVVNLVVLKVEKMEPYLVAVMVDSLGQKWADLWVAAKG